MLVPHESDDDCLPGGEEVAAAGAGHQRGVDAVGHVGDLDLAPVSRVSEVCIGCGYELVHSDFITPLLSQGQIGLIYAESGLVEYLSLWSSLYWNSHL